MGVLTKTCGVLENFHGFSGSPSMEKAHRISSEDAHCIVGNVLLRSLQGNAM